MGIRSGQIIIDHVNQQRNHNSEEKNKERFFLGGGVWGGNSPWGE